MIKSFLRRPVQYSKFIFSNKNPITRDLRLIQNSTKVSLLSGQHLVQHQFKSFHTRKSSGSYLSPMNSPNQIVDIKLRDKAHRICCEYLGGAWSKISPSEMSFTPISGGMSNLLFCCSLPESIQLSNGEPSQTLLRLYGDQSRNCDMSLQVQIFKLLSLKELGPKLYGDFEDGRLEEFLPANSLTCEELMNREISFIIARKMATVHSLDVPISKGNTWILDRFQEWVGFIEEQAKQPQFACGTRESTIKIANELLAIDYGKEIKFLCKVFDGTRSPIVFSHNDLHQGNILLVKPSKRRPILEKRVILIDFEYCSYNYRAYDIANHFCEWCFEYDTPEYPHFILFEDRFPSESTQREFIRNYLDQQKKLPNEKQHQQNGSTTVAPSPSVFNNGTLDNGSGSKDNPCVANNGYTNGHRDVSNAHSSSNKTKISNGTTPSTQSVSNDEIDIILNEVKPFCMAANLVWTLWCIKSAHSSNIKFGYWEHAMTRWKLYLSFKSSYLRETLSTDQTNGKSNISRD